jgi:SAM-dependent methyltransferase
MIQQDKHFHMSDIYESNSLSQKTIGRTVIQCAVEMAKSAFQNPQKIKALDIACGPGNLTIEFLNALQDAFPDTIIELAGLDYSEQNVKRLIKNSEGRIKGIVGSFYNLHAETKGQNIIISNEGLHWQTPFKMSKIYFAYLDTEEKEKYELHALHNLETAIKNIYESLQDGGIAVLQFGQAGNVQKHWDVIYSVFNESPFNKYMDKINIPLCFLSIKQIYSALIKAGFATENININAFDQDMTEDNAAAITNLHRAVSQEGYGKVFPPDILEAFYKRMEEKLSSIDINEFKKNQWHRTLIKLKKQRLNK